MHDFLKEVLNYSPLAISPSQDYKAPSKTVPFPKQCNLK